MEVILETGGIFVSSTESNVSCCSCTFSTTSRLRSIGATEGAGLNLAPRLLLIALLLVFAFDVSYGILFGLCICGTGFKWLLVVVVVVILLLLFFRNNIVPIAPPATPATNK